MPNNEHVAMLARGAPVWNAWRSDHDETPDLSRAGLRGLDLNGFDLSRADLRGADLRGTNLIGANLSGAYLNGANLFKAVLDGAEWSPILELRSALPPGTGRRPSAMTSLPVARLFQTGNHQNKPPCADVKRSAARENQGDSLDGLPA
jgi:hypothetical protein